jgi:hypothetical protein
MNFRTLVLALITLAVSVSTPMAFESAQQDSIPKGAPTSAKAANTEIGALLKKKTKVGSHIKVVDAKGEHAGTLAKITDTALDMDVETESAYIPLAIQYQDVESVWKRRSHAGMGALVGLVVGGTVGFLTAKAANDGSMLEEESGAAGAFLGVLIGAGVGAVVGSEIHSYNLIYPK